MSGMQNAVLQLRQFADTPVTARDRHFKRALLTQLNGLLRVARRQDRSAPWPDGDVGPCFQALRPFAADGDSTIRASTFRTLRYIICCPEHVKLLDTCKLNLCVVRGIERDQKFVWERLQCIKLLRHCLKVAPTQVGRAMVRALVAVAQHAADNCRRVALETLRFGAVNGAIEVVAQCGGVSALFDAVLDVNCQDMSAPILLSLLLLMNSDNRRYLRPFASLQRILSVFTSELEGYEPTPETEATWKAAQAAIITLMRSWTGFTLLASDPHGLASLVSILYHPVHPNLLLAVLHTIGYILHPPTLSPLIPPPKPERFPSLAEPGDSAVAAASRPRAASRPVAPFVQQYHSTFNPNIPESTLSTAALASTPPGHQVQVQNVLDSYVGTVLLALLERKLVMGLTILCTHSDRRIAAAATGLLGDVISLAARVLPEDAAAQYLSMPVLVQLASLNATIPEPGGLGVTDGHTHATHTSGAVAPAEYHDPARAIRGEWAFGARNDLRISGVHIVSGERLVLDAGPGAVTLLPDVRAHSVRAATVLRLLANDTTKDFTSMELSNMHSRRSLYRASLLIADTTRYLPPVADHDRPFVDIDDGEDMELAPGLSSDEDTGGDSSGGDDARLRSSSDAARRDSSSAAPITRENWAPAGSRDRSRSTVGSSSGADTPRSGFGAFLSRLGVGSNQPSPKPPTSPRPEERDRSDSAASQPMRRVATTPDARLWSSEVPASPAPSAAGGSAAPSGAQDAAQSSALATRRPTALTMAQLASMPGVRAPGFVAASVAADLSAAGYHVGKRTINAEIRLARTLGTTEQQVIDVVRQSKVLLIKDWRCWNWDIIADLLDGPFTNPTFLVEAIRSKFMRRLGGFFRADTGSKGGFAALPWLPASLKFLRVARQWLLLLLHHEEGLIFLRTDRRGRAIIDTLAELNRIALQTPMPQPPVGPAGMFSPSRFWTTMAREFIVLLGLVSSCDAGRSYLRDIGQAALLATSFDVPLTLNPSASPWPRSALAGPEAGKVSISSCLSSLANLSARDHLTRLLIVSLDFASYSSARLFIQLAITSPTVSEGLRLFATCYLRALLRSGASNFSQWAIDMLVTLLHTDSRPIQDAALSVLIEAAQHDVYLSAIIEKRSVPATFPLQRSLPLLLRFVSKAAGLEQLEQHNVLLPLMESWQASHNVEYAARVESCLLSGLMTHGGSPGLSEADGASPANAAQHRPVPIPVWTPAGPNCGSLEQGSYSLHTLYKLPWRIEVMVEWADGDGASLSTQQLQVDTFFDASQYRPETPTLYPDFRITGILLNSTGKASAFPVPPNAKLKAALFVGAVPVDANGNSRFGAHPDTSDTNLPLPGETSVGSASLTGQTIRQSGALSWTQDVGVVRLSASVDNTSVSPAGMRTSTSMTGLDTVAGNGGAAGGAAGEQLTSNGTNVATNSALVGAGLVPDSSQPAELSLLEPTEATAFAVGSGLKGATWTTCTTANLVNEQASLTVKKRLGTASSDSDVGPGSEIDSDADAMEPTGLRRRESVISRMMPDDGLDSDSYIDRDSPASFAEPQTPGSLTKLPSAYGVARGGAVQRTRGRTTSEAMRASVCTPGESALWHLSTSLMFAGSVRLESVSFCILPEPYRPGAVPIPRHLYGELAKTDRGCHMLAESGQIPLMIAHAEDHALPSLHRRAALWALGHIGACESGYQLMVRLVPDVLDRLLCVTSKSTVLSLRGTCLYMLGLISESPSGAAALAARGWLRPPGTRFSVLPKSTSALVQVPVVEFAGSMAVDDPTDVPDGLESKIDPEVPPSLADEIVQCVGKLANAISQKEARKRLQDLQQQQPEVFRSVPLFLRVHRVLGRYNFQLPTRRFVHALFADVPFDAPAWPLGEAAPIPPPLPDVVDSSTPMVVPGPVPDTPRSPVPTDDSEQPTQDGPASSSVGQAETAAAPVEAAAVQVDMPDDA